MATSKQNIQSLTIESVGFVLGLLYHVTGDHVEEAGRDVQPPLEVVGRRSRISCFAAAIAAVAGGLEQPGQLGLELGQPQVGVQHGAGGRDHGGHQRQERFLLLMEPQLLRRRRRRRCRQVGKIWRSERDESFLIIILSF